MLLVWMFALSSSIVNACLADHGPWQASSTASQHAGHAPQPIPCPASVVAADDAAGHEQGVQPAGAGACAKFCVDKSCSAPVYKQAIDAPGTVWLAPPPAPSLDAQAARQQWGLLRAEQALPGTRVPIAIAFLRLTL